MAPKRSATCMVCGKRPFFCSYVNGDMLCAACLAWAIAITGHQ